MSNQPPTIPLVDLRVQFHDIRTEVLNAIDDVLSEMRLFLGDNVTAFEREFADYCGVRECVGVGSGTDALVLALRAAGVGAGDEVITVGNTFIATVEAIVLVGATPVLVDIDPDTYTMDPDALAARISSRTRAIVPVHLYGQLADMPRIMRVAQRHGLLVIEDACQAHGAKLAGKRAGSFGDAACFSFYFSKNLGAYGEAGAVLTNNSEVARQIVRIRNHGQTGKYDHQVLGVNSRLDELQAAVLRIKLRHLDDWNDRRRSHATNYNQLLAGTGLVLPSEAPGSRHVYHLYVVRSSNRDSIITGLGEAGVGTGIHYPVPIHLQPAWVAHGFAPVSLPITEAYAREIVSLPLYPELTETEIEFICQQVGAAINSRPTPVLA